MEKRLPRAFLLSAVFLTVDLGLLFILMAAHHYLEFKAATWNDAIYSAGMSVGGRLLYLQGFLQLLFLTFVYARKNSPSLLLCLATVAVSFFIAVMMMTQGVLYRVLYGIVPDFSITYFPFQLQILLTVSAAWFSIKLLTERGCRLAS